MVMEQFEFFLLSQGMDIVKGDEEWYVSHLDDCAGWHEVDRSLVGTQYEASVMNPIRRRINS